MRCEKDELVSINLGSVSPLGKSVRPYKVRNGEEPNIFSVQVSSEEMEIASGPGAVGATTKERFMHMTNAMSMAPLPDKSCVWNATEEGNYGVIGVSGNEQLHWAEKALLYCGLERD